MGISADFSLDPFDPLVNVESGNLTVKLSKGRNLIAADITGKVKFYFYFYF